MEEFYDSYKAECDDFMRCIIHQAKAFHPGCLVSVCLLIIHETLQDPKIPAKVKKHIVETLTKEDA